MPVPLDIQEYFESLDEYISKAYGLANKARAQNKDPEQHVDIPIAEDLAARVEGLLSSIFPEFKGSGLKENIREFEKLYGKNDERVALKIAEETATSKFCSFDSKEKALEAGVRVGLAYLTLGIVTAPLEGITHVKIVNDYVVIYYSGPIRSAGGTAEALSVVVADYVRRKLNIGAYQPTDTEKKRYITEINDYHRLVRLQYAPSENEILHILDNLEVCLAGEPTEKQEVSNYKDLPRVDTNRIRGGMCLVLAEGLASKVPKLLKRLSKIEKEFDFSNWKWLQKQVEIKNKGQASTKVEDANVKYTPSKKYVEKVIAGRPLFSHPAKPGGFRLRYGKSRTAGIASTSIHPATMHLTEFIAVGTQLATELPGKATVSTPCSTIEGPAVLLKNGEVKIINTVEDAIKFREEVKEILSLGDILIPYGEFLSQNHILLPAAFCEEWWGLELKRAAENLNLRDEKIDSFIETPFLDISFDEAYELSKKFNIPLHPKFNFFWHDLTKENLKDLLGWVAEASFDKTKQYLLLGNTWKKQLLEQICMPHKIDSTTDKIVVNLETSPLYQLLGKPRMDNLKTLIEIVESSSNIMNAISSLAGVLIKEKGLTRVGIKMGRPEKAERRLMRGRPQILFPCGEEGGRMRNIIESNIKGQVEAEFPTRYCEKCDKPSFYKICFECGEATKPQFFCPNCKTKFTNKQICRSCGAEAFPFKQMRVCIKPYLEKAAQNIGFKTLPELFKGVRGVSGKDRDIEPIEKGLLRVKYDLYVNKDGTTRYDMTDVPLTHFKPKEIGISIKKIMELGYENDIKGQQIKNEEQIIELKPQDIVISDNKDFSAVNYLINICNFVDELLVKVYNLEPFYNVKSAEDLIGHLVIGLAPHTSAGIIGRIIGFTPAKVCFAHPLWHCAKKRNADGDEDSILLLMDALLNFSRKFLPTTRGAATMDAPLVLTTHLFVEEGDDEAWNVDAVNFYPLEFYYDTFEYKAPWAISKKIKVVADNLNSEQLYYTGFTHDTNDINEGPYKTKYVSIEAMPDKVRAQLRLATMIKAVDENDVAEKILEKHFLRDIKGNLRTFSRQKIRCTSCNTKYRRPPLQGKCLKCGSSLLLTVAEGTIRKYFEPSKQIINNFQVSSYLKQQLMILENEVDALFGRRGRQLSLDGFHPPNNDVV